MPFEDRIRELKKVKEDRKIGAIGPNEVAVGQIIAALELVEIDSGQSQYSITRRQRDGELDPSRCDTDLCGVVDEGAVGARLAARSGRRRGAGTAECGPDQGVDHPRGEDRIHDDRATCPVTSPRAIGELPWLGS
ncbi:MULTISPECIES: aldo-keto reductase family protein [Streptomyces]|uniref:hypothetical protein n=1 Tax=Streptomyces TaxID=1883 RepID=UPI002300244A|nr:MULTISPECIES: hypothetical protein [Streptomyces]